MRLLKDLLNIDLASNWVSLDASAQLVSSSRSQKEAVNTVEDRAQDMEKVVESVADLAWQSVLSTNEAEDLLRLSARLDDASTGLPKAAASHIHQLTQDLALKAIGTLMGTDGTVPSKLSSEEAKQVLEVHRRSGLIDRYSQFRSSWNDSESIESANNQQTLNCFFDGLSLHEKEQAFLLLLGTDPKLANKVVACKQMSGLLDKRGPQLIRKCFSQAACKDLALQVPVSIPLLVAIDKAYGLDRSRLHEVLETDELSTFAKAVDWKPGFSRYDYWFDVSYHRHSYSWTIQPDKDEVISKLKKSLKEIEKLPGKKVPVPMGTLVSAITVGDEMVVEELLSLCDAEWLMHRADELLTAVMRSADPKLMQLVMARAPQLPSTCSETTLLAAAEGGYRDFLLWTLNNGREVNRSLLLQLISSAKDRCDLLLLRQLCTIGERQELLDKKELYPAILQLDQLSAEDLGRFASAAALSSPLNELYALAATYPQLGGTLVEAVKNAALAVRFPLLTYIGEATRHADYAEYIRSTAEYVKENRDSLKKLLSEPNLATDRKAFLSRVVEERCQLPKGTLQDPSSAKKNSLARQQGGYVVEPESKDWQECTTTLYYSTTMAEDRDYMNPYADLWNRPGRYSWSRRHLRTAFKDQDLWTKSSVVVEDGIATFMYPNSSNEKPSPLTVFPDRIFSRFGASASDIVWKHSPLASIMQLRPELSRLHQEIMSYKLDLEEEENKKPFFEMIARAYWLTATLCEMNRGTPHNSMMWLNYVYAHHHLPPPVPKQEHFFLDNTMLMVPVEFAIRDWESYFEPSMDEALGGVKNAEARAQVAKILKQDGLALRLCSPAVRSDPELARIAIDQNPLAEQYASFKV